MLSGGLYTAIRSGIIVVTDRSKINLTVDQANELIEEVTASDRQQARLALSGGVQAAQKQWIAAPLIIEAMALELTILVQDIRSGSDVANYLRSLANLIESQTDLH